MLASHQSHRALTSIFRRISRCRRGAATSTQQKRAGDISDAFASLSGIDFKPLTPEYAALKTRLRNGREDALRDSWERLLKDLREEIPLITALKSSVVPEIDFKDIDSAPETFKKEHKKRGVAVIRGVVPQQEALRWKDDLKEYIKANPHTKGTPNRYYMYNYRG